jgi:hypothetical protein
MSRTEPYPVGTRVMLTWNGCQPQYIGSVGTIVGDGVSGYFRHFPSADGGGLPHQEVSWDGQGVGSCPIPWMSPLDDPDAEPVREEDGREMTA